MKKSLIGLVALTALYSAPSLATPILDVKDDCQYLRKAIASMSSTFDSAGKVVVKGSGGVVQIEAKLHVCSAPIFIESDNIHLKGAGSNASIIKLKDNVHAPMIVVGSPSGINNETGRFGTTRIVRNIQVSDLTLDGNKMNHDVTKECYEHICDGDATSIRNNGLTIRGAYDVEVTNVVTHDMISGGMVTEKDVRNLLVLNFESYANYYDGFAGYETENSRFYNMHLHNNRGAGVSIDIQFNNNKIMLSRLIDNGDVGVFARDLSGNLFQEVKIIGSGNHGVFLAKADAPNSCAENNRFHDVTITQSKGAGIRLNNGCKGNIVSGNSNLNGNNLGKWPLTPNSCISEDVKGTVSTDSTFVCE